MALVVNLAVNPYTRSDIGDLDRPRTAKQKQAKHHLSTTWDMLVKIPIPQPPWPSTGCLQVRCSNLDCPVQGCGLVLVVSVLIAIWCIQTKTYKRKLKAAANWHSEKAIRVLMHSSIARFQHIPAGTRVFHQPSKTMNNPSMIDSRCLKICIGLFLVCPKTSKQSKAAEVLYEYERCCCGRRTECHAFLTTPADQDESGGHEWTMETCTALFPTDTFGTLVFSGEKRAQKAKYIRVDSDTDPSDLWHLLIAVWDLEPPSLVITIHGGEGDQFLSSAFIRAFKAGLARAAQTMSTWIITSGMQTAITELLADSLTDRSRSRSIHLIGFASWGLIHGAEKLSNTSADVHFQTAHLNLARNGWKCGDYDLCPGHSAFVLVDDGTRGLPSISGWTVRHRFEKFLRSIKADKEDGGMAIVSLMVSGGLSAVDSMVEYLSDENPVPVVICAETGGIADWIAGLLEKIEDGLEAFPDGDLVRGMQTLFDLSESSAQRLAGTLKETILSKRDHITVYRVSDSAEPPQENQLDFIMLNAVLKFLPLSLSEKLNLCIEWDREDLAREILQFISDEESDWLDETMTNALVYDRAGLVNMLLSRGIAMDRFLTITRLEGLYNSGKGPPNTLRLTLPHVLRADPNHKFKLQEVGRIIEKFMCYGYRSTYCRKEFLKRYNTESHEPQGDNTVSSPRYRIRRTNTVSRIGMQSIGTKRSSIFHPYQIRSRFAYPFHELFIWAVLTNRKQLAMFFWQHGHDQLAKALIGNRLYQALARDAQDDFLQMDVSQQLELTANQFKSLAHELLSQCHETNDDMTLQLLTYELRQFSKSTCISLAVKCLNYPFVAHQSCQLLLADLWLGGLRVRKYINFKVIAGILFPPVMALLTFKTAEELHLQAQTAEEAQKIRESCSDRRKSWQDDGSDWNSEDESESGEENLAFVGDVQMIPMFQDHNEERPRMAETPAVSPIVAKRSVTFSPSFGQDHDIQSQISLSRSNPSTSTTETGQNRWTEGVEYDSDEEMNWSQVMARPTTRRFATASELVAEQLGVKFLFDKPPIEMGSSKQHSLPTSRKVLEFYSAPITAFWSFCMGYVVFLSLFTYIVLVKTPLVPSWPEYYVISFMITFSADQIRKVLIQEPRRLAAKVKVFAGSVWDSCTVLACACFFLALFLRVHPDTLATGRVLYCVNIVFWYLRILRLLNVNNSLSPYIYMYGKMIMQLLLMSVILLVIVAVFGIVRQSILYNDEDWQWAMLRNIFYKPYAMLYGALYEGEITECDDFGTNCVPGYWLTPIFMCLYMLLAVLMFLNIIVAAISNIFEEVTARAQEIAKFGAYRHLMEFEQQPFLPPPLIVFSHIYYIGRFLYKRFYRKDKNYRFEHSLKLLLTPEEKEKLYDFESLCLTELLAKKADKEKNSLKARLDGLSERVDSMMTQIDHLHQQTQQHRSALSKMEQKNAGASECSKPRMGSHFGNCVPSSNIQTCKRRSSVFPLFKYVSRDLDDS